MLDRLTELAAESLRRDNPALEQVRIVGLEETGGQPSYRQWSVRLTWLAGGMRYLDTFVARTVPGAADPSRLSELGHRLDAAGIRVPALVGVSADPIQSLLLFETAPGQPAARVLAHTRLRWEISALAVTLAIALPVFAGERLATQTGVQQPLPVSMASPTPGATDTSEAVTGVADGLPGSPATASPESLVGASPVPMPAATVSPEVARGALWQ